MNGKHPMLSTPQDVVRRGEEIYAQTYKEDYEARYQGKFVAIDVMSGKAYVADFADDVLQEARKAAPAGIFHLIKVGFSGAFRVSSSFATVRDNGVVQQSW